MRKNIQIMIEAAGQTLQIWRRSIVVIVLLFALCFLEYFPDQWRNYEITSDVPLVLTQTLVLVVFPLTAVRIIIDWRTMFDEYRWWRILGYVAGGVIGCIISLLVRKLIWSFTCEGFVKGWACFAAAAIVLTVLDYVAGWRSET